MRKLIAAVCTDASHVDIDGAPLADADPAAFPAGKPVTECSESRITFGE